MSLVVVFRKQILTVETTIINSKLWKLRLQIDTKTNGKLARIVERTKEWMCCNYHGKFCIFSSWTLEDYQGLNGSDCSTLRGWKFAMGIKFFFFLQFLRAPSHSRKYVNCSLSHKKQREFGESVYWFFSLSLFPYITFNWARILVLLNSSPPPLNC